MNNTPLPLSHPLRRVERCVGKSCDRQVLRTRISSRSWSWGLEKSVATHRLHSAHGLPRESTESWLPHETRPWHVRTSRACICLFHQTGGHVGSPETVGVFWRQLLNASFHHSSDLSRDRLWQVGLSLTGNDMNLGGARCSSGLGAWKGSMIG